MMSAAVAAVPLITAGPEVVGAAVVLVMLPAVELVTFIATRQVAPAAMVPAVKRMLLSPAAEAAPDVFVTVPQAAGVKVKVVFWRVSPDGKVSSVLTTVRLPALAAGFPSVSVSVVLPPASMLATPKVLVRVGAA